MQAASNLPNRTPAVSRIVGGSIVELVYDGKTRETQFAVSEADGGYRLEKEFKIGPAEILVPYSPHNNLIAHGCVLFPEGPESYGSKAGLLRDLEAYLHRYVDLSAVFERIAAHYILLTWVYDAFAEVPYLRFRGEYGTGKTRALIAVGSVCYKPFFAAGASTVSPIFHTLDRFGGTLILDEADFRFTDATADLVKLFNNGTVKGLPVLRTIQNRQKEFNPAAFNVFGPKIIAMRGRFEDEALESRFLTEETGARNLRPDIPLHLPDSLHEEALALRNRLLDYRLRHRLEVRPNGGLADLSLDPRLNQISLPLLSLIDDAELRGTIQSLLKGETVKRWEQRRSSLEARVLIATLERLAHAAGSDVSVQSVADACNDAPGSGAVSARRVGAILKAQFGIETRKSNGVYVLAAADREHLLQFAALYHLAQNPAEAPGGTVC